MIIYFLFIFNNLHFFFQLIQTKIQQVAPGIVQQIEQICRSCSGVGEIIAAKDRCKTCNGKKTVRDKKILEVNIDKGMRDGQRIVFSGEGDQEPDLKPGDIVIVLDEKQHPVFSRSNDNLIINFKLQMVEALCGFQKVIKTLDNRDLVITSYPGEVIRHDQLKYIMNEGMPQYKNPFEKGRLVIQFSVEFPKAIPAELIPALEQCLPPRPEVTVPIDAEECTMTDYGFAEERETYRQAYEEDDPNSGQGQKYGQCSTS